eukprot:TRINITY_DN76683_c0_g1_i1.p1 TRINITY_DN76683_c0_g1~~TRINITY_DN76683_c0_g1_i1.p1  ORF type:complete len:550 (+),score=100.77 TRINITY_DN76683_c0_g1_i1:82-1731(+)
MFHRSPGEDDAADVARRYARDRNIQKTQAAALSLNFIENTKRQRQQRLETLRLEKWTAGNHDSTLFFKKMGASMAEAEKARKTCSGMSQASSARDAAEKVNLDYIRKSVESARGISAYSRDFVSLDQAGRPQTTLPVTAPGFLKHLQAPSLPQSGALTSRPQSRQCRKQVQSQESTRPPTQDTSGGRSPLLPSAAWDGRLAEAEDVADRTVEVAPPPLFPREMSESPRDTDSLCNFGEGGSSKKSSRHNSKENLTLQNNLAMDAEKTRKSSARASIQSKVNLLAPREDSSASSDDEGEVDKEEAWPPPPPILRFRAQCQFSTEFKSSERLRQEREERKAEEEKTMLLQGGQDKIEDFTLTWANKYFKLDVETENQYHAAFPLIILLMLDVIYPKKIRWHQVDWNAGYLHAFHRNHAILEKIWQEINMHKLRDFRSDMTTLQIEDTVQANIEEKLAFLKTTKRWFDQRVAHSSAYDPIARRTEIDRMVRITGRFANFPAWMQHDKEAIQAARSVKKGRLPATSSTETEYDKMPEFKRLIWFLGSTDQTNL